MSALMVAFVRVHDLEAYNREYLSAAHPLIAEYGGKALVVSENVKLISGNLPEGKFVILEFPNVDQANAYFYSDEHQELLKNSERYFSSDSVIVDNELQ